MKELLGRFINHYCGIINCHNYLTPYFFPYKSTHPIAWGYYKSWCDIWPIRALSLGIRWTSPPTARSLQWRGSSRVFKVNWWRSCVQTLRFLLFKLLYLARRTRRTSRCAWKYTHIWFSVCFVTVRHAHLHLPFLCEVHMWHAVNFFVIMRIFCLPC